MKDSWLGKLRSAAKWLYPGLGVKRWLLLAMMGLIVLLGGVFLFWSRSPFFEERILYFVEMSRNLSLQLPFIAAVIFLGLLLHLWGLQQTANAITSILLPYRGRRLIEKLYARRYLEKGPKIVSIGGGTGLSVLLRGLKEYTSNITAVVTVTDDGGSSGRIRGEMGTLPPGDLRNCLLALADTEPLLEELFQHRFRGGKSLEGHNIGNLLIVAMTEMMGFERAIREFSKVLAIRGTVFPVTLDQVALQATFSDGCKMTGETAIVKQGKRIKHITISPASCKPLPEVISAIKEADAIVLGPGSLYTSLLPNLLIPGVKEAIKESSALCFYVCNIMTQPGETQGFSASMHLEALRDHGCDDIIDAVIINSETDISPELAKKYKEEGSEVVEVDHSALSRWNKKIIQAPLLDRGQLARHDGRKLAALILEKLIERETGLEGLWAFTFMSLNGNFRRARKKITDSPYNPFLRE